MVSSVQFVQALNKLYMHFENLVIMVGFAPIWGRGTKLDITSKLQNRKLRQLRPMGSCKILIVFQTKNGGSFCGMYIFTFGEGCS